MTTAPKIFHVGATATGEEVAVIEDPLVGRPFLITYDNLDVGEAIPGGRAQINGLHLFGAPGYDPPSRELLRNIGGSIDRVEAILNSKDLRERMIHRLLALHADASTLTDPKTVEEIWTAYQTNSDRPEVARARRRSRKLRVPNTKKFPDEFYERVAGLYSELVADGERPASVIATANGIPVSTVHTWIREARRRGKLPKGRAGKAG